MSFIDDYSSIASALKAREEEKQPKSPIVTDPNPPEYAEPNPYKDGIASYLERVYPHGYLEAFKAYASAANSMPFQVPDLRLNSMPSQLNDWARNQLINGREWQKN